MFCKYHAIWIALRNLGRETIAAASSRSNNHRCKSCIPTTMAAINTPPSPKVKNPCRPEVGQKFMSTDERNAENEYDKYDKDSYYLPINEYADCSKSKCYDSANSDRQSMVTSNKIEISQSRISRKDNLLFKNEHAPNKQLSKSSVINSNSSTQLPIKDIDCFNRKNSSSKETITKDWPYETPLLGLKNPAETQNLRFTNKTNPNSRQPSQRNCSETQQNTLRYFTNI